MHALIFGKLYRCRIIWGRNNYIIFIPCLAVLASICKRDQSYLPLSLAYVFYIALSVIACVQTAVPGNSIWASSAYNFAVPYWSLSIAVNLLLTIAIVIRLLIARKQLKTAMGEEYALEYTSLIAIFVESASLYSITSLIYIVAFAVNSNLQNLILPLQAGLMVCGLKAAVRFVPFY